MRNPIPNWSLPLLSGVFFFLFLEGALALFAPHKIVTRQFINQYDQDLGWENKPNQQGRVYINREISFIRTHNSAGLRATREIDYDSDPSAKHILLLGDSFFWGFGVDDEDVLSEILQERARSNVEIINGAVQGYGTDQQLIWLTAEGFKYHPETVVLGFFPTNDLDEIANSVMYGRPKPLFDLHGNKLELHNVPVPETPDPRRKGFERPPTLFGRVKQFLRYHTHTYPFLVERLNSIPQIRRALISVGLADEYTQSVGSIPHYRTDPDQVPALSDALILEIRDACRKQQVKFLLVHIPRRERADFENDLVFGTTKPEEWNDQASAHLVKLAKREGIELLDMLPIVREHERKGEVLYVRKEYDHHWTPRGHEVAAQAIQDRLEKMNAL